MPITLPANSPYQGPVTPLPAVWMRAPAEGPKFVNFDIVWVTNTAGNLAVQCNTGNATTPLSQLVAVTVDNSRCGSDLQLVFPDSGFVLNIPAYGGGTYPVFTNAIQFYAVALGATAADESIVTVHNTMPPPVVVEQSDFQQASAVSAFAIANGTTTILANTVTGTIRAGFLDMLITGPGSFNWQLQSVLPTPKILMFGSGGASTGQTVINDVPIPDTFLRFTGLQFVMSSVAGGVTGTISPNIFYSIP